MKRQVTEILYPDREKILLFLVLVVIIAMVQMKYYDGTVLELVTTVEYGHADTADGPIPLATPVPRPIGVMANLCSGYFAAVGLITGYRRWQHE